ncbi:MAG: radical SAM protein [Clostridia bacterium]|nr:radical SAM protein [Clostridia bacterium]
MKKHINIPIFIPHLGCPNDCVFCNQRSISGRQSFDVSDVEPQIERVLSTLSEDTEREIAFFGGSFTGIDRELMLYLLGVAKKYIDDGRVSGIRLSTRPDYIDRERLDILSQYGVSAVELGLQSMDEKVLAASRRGHTAADAERACALIKEYGFELVGQMMIGLPESSPETEVYTARRICEMGADGARVYPTVVFYGTELCRMAQSGRYTPLSQEDAVTRTRNVLDVFDRAGVRCIRVGLCASENLSDEDEVFGGANHSAVGELAMGELYFDRIVGELDRLGKEGDFAGKSLTIYAARGATSKVVGQNKRNKLRLCKKYGFNRIKILEKSEIIGYNIILDIDSFSGKRFSEGEERCEG